MGPVGIVYLNGDIAAGAKVAVEFAKDHDKFVVSSGLLDGELVSVAEIETISDLPSKDVLLAQILGSLIAPHKGIMGILNGVPRSLVQVVNAIKDTKN